MAKLSETAAKAAAARLQAKKQAKTKPASKPVSKEAPSVEQESPTSSSALAARQSSNSGPDLSDFGVKDIGALATTGTPLDLNNLTIESLLADPSLNKSSTECAIEIAKYRKIRASLETSAEKWNALGAAISEETAKIKAQTKAIKMEGRKADQEAAAYRTRDKIEAAAFEKENLALSRRQRAARTTIKLCSTAKLERRAKSSQGMNNVDLGIPAGDIIDADFTPTQNP